MVDCPPPQDDDDDVVGGADGMLDGIGGEVCHSPDVPGEGVRGETYWFRMPRN